MAVAAAVAMKSDTIVVFGGKQKDSHLSQSYGFNTRENRVFSINRNQQSSDDSDYSCFTVVRQVGGIDKPPELFTMMESESKNVQLVRISFD